MTSIAKPRYNKRPIEDLKPIRKDINGQSDKKPGPMMLARPYFIRPNYAPTKQDTEFLSAELLVWGEKESSLRIEDFCHFKKIPYDTFRIWCKMHPDLNAARKIVRSLIASRRELAGLTGKHNASMAMFILPNYDRGYLNMLKLRAKLNKQEDGPKQTVVVIERAPESKMVPEKENKDENRE